MLKRAVDLIGALVGIIVLLPLWLLLAFLIKLESPGPVLYRSRRMGQGMKPFRVFKFRSMRVAGQGGAITAPGDRRITRLGAWMRLFKLDELPQLWNVLRGEMSLVGPRPEAIEFIEKHYTEAQKRVLTVKPGMTGIGQVTFFPDMTGEVPDDVDPYAYYIQHQLPKKLAVDLIYVEKQSFFYDVWILLRTLYLVLFKGWWLFLMRPPKELKRKRRKQETRR